jgi:tRNA(Ile)-lysidine synthase
LQVPAGVAQLVRACGSYPQGPGFKSLHRHHTFFADKENFPSSFSLFLSLDMELSQRVLATIRRFAMIPRGGRVLAAVSGGSDSVALLHLLRELETSADLVVAGVAHVNHGLRAAADADEEFCRQLARNLAIPFHVERYDVREVARELHTSVEDAGRHVRYEFFARIASGLGADAVATGHTRDDQAETFLLRLIRGAGLRGLSSIRPKAGVVVRPLLEASRLELRQWLAERGIAFQEDETNEDRSFARNRVRHELIPNLQRAFSPGVVDVLAREAAVAREDDDCLERQAIELASSLVLISEAGGDVRLSSSEPDEVKIDVHKLLAAHPALAFRIARLALSALARGRFVGFDHVERVLTLARQSEGANVSLPGQHATRRADKIVLRRTQSAPFSNSFRIPLSIPGEVVLEAQGWAVSAFSGPGETGPIDRNNGWHIPGIEHKLSGRTGQLPGGHVTETGATDPARLDPLTAFVRADRPVLPLAVRSRRPGDRFQPLGLGGRGKKLQDFLVDRKVPREERDSLPLVVDGDDRIVWIVGQSVAEDFRVTEPLQGVIFLKARRLGGLG